MQRELDIRAVSFRWWFPQSAPSSSRPCRVCRYVRAPSSKRSSWAVDRSGPPVKWRLTLGSATGSSSPACSGGKDCRRCTI